MQKQISYGKDYCKKPNEKTLTKDVVKNWLRSKNTLEYLEL